jgi:6-phosphogluconolactonase/glucosamine-6-phosphate isomerase/deaminase
MIDYFYAEKPTNQAASTVAKMIKTHLKKNERVLWLLSGGSGIEIAIKVSKSLAKSDLSNLFVSLTDERYGEIGHRDENWQQLLDAGLSLPGANLYRPLIGKGIEQTVAEFNDWLNTQLKVSDYKIAIFGLGTDGHTAGIKPRSSATKSQSLVVSFIGDDFERITITFDTIRKIDDAVIQAYGADKQAIIEDLINNTVSYIDQPAQILKFVPHAALYTNNKKEE